LHPRDYLKNTFGRRKQREVDPRATRALQLGNASEQVSLPPPAAGEVEWIVLAAPAPVNGRYLD
jgi:hypothetical protein